MQKSNHLGQQFKTVLPIQKYNYLKLKQLSRLKERGQYRSMILKSAILSPPKSRIYPSPHLRHDKSMQVTNSSFNAIHKKVKENYRFANICFDQVKPI